MRAPLLACCLALPGCFEPSVLTAPLREASMPIVGHGQTPQPIVAQRTGAPEFDRSANQSASEGVSLLGQQSTPATGAPHAP